MENLPAVVKTAYELYEIVKRRQSGIKRAPGCGKDTNCYYKGKEWCGGGTRWGPCGTEKDDKRIYWCENCRKVK